MKTVKEIMKEYKQGLLDLDDLFLEWGDYQFKATKFVNHVENHLKELKQKGVDVGNGKVHCKICLKDIDQINKEEQL